ncbi:hypothetical protein Tco_0668817 [Tanacetum coccineum]
MKAVQSSSHALIVPLLSSSSHVIASPVSDRGNIISRMGLFSVSLYLNISHILRNFSRNGGSFLCSNGTLLFHRRSLRFRVSSGLGSGSTSSELEARVCVQGSYMVQFSKKMYGDFEKASG